MKKAEETWQPISEWGRSFREYRRANVYVKQARPAAKAHKVGVRRANRKTYTPFVPTTFCSVCEHSLSPQNRSGLCEGCGTTKRRSELKHGPRPTCKVCGATLNRQSKSFLCGKHSASSRQMAYMARKKAA